MVQNARLATGDLTQAGRKIVSDFRSWQLKTTPQRSRKAGPLSDGSHRLSALLAHGVAKVIVVVAERAGIIDPRIVDPQMAPVPVKDLEALEAALWWLERPEMVRRVQDAIDDPSEGTSDFHWRAVGT